MNHIHHASATGYIHQVNPAAILGYSLPCIHLRELAPKPSPDMMLQAGRFHGGSGAVNLSVDCKDASVLRVLESVPGFTELNIGYYGARGIYTSLSAYKLTYDQLLALLGALHKVGVEYDSELANQQARAAAFGVTGSALLAYNQFKADATAFLQKVQALNLVPLASRQGIRQVETPFRALGLVQGSGGVLVTPDPHDSRYVQVTIRGGLYRADIMTLRQMAFDHYEPLGMRVQFSEI